MEKNKKHILWADDEIKSLKPHIIYLEEKGYKVSPVNSGEDAIDFCSKTGVDILLVDEMMTGLDGLSTIKIITHELSKQLKNQNDVMQDIKLLSRYISEKGKIIPSRITYVSRKKQKELSIAIKRARFLSLMSFTNKFN